MDERMDEWIDEASTGQGRKVNNTSKNEQGNESVNICGGRALYF